MRIANQPDLYSIRPTPKQRGMGAENALPNQGMTSIKEQAEETKALPPCKPFNPLTFDVASLQAKMRAAKEAGGDIEGMVNGVKANSGNPYALGVSSAEDWARFRREQIEYNQYNSMVDFYAKGGTYGRLLETYRPTDTFLIDGKVFSLREYAEWHDRQFPPQKLEDMPRGVNHDKLMREIGLK